jgi:predicted PhzF superfamily epimerase YddE/YHI9
LPDTILRNIAAENNLSETAFLKAREDYYELRWFTPEVEVDLCGHATLASAFVLFSERAHPGDQVRFRSQSGWLAATRRGDTIELDFPSRGEIVPDMTWPPQTIPAPFP